MLIERLCILDQKLYTLDVPISEKRYDKWLRDCRNGNQDLIQREFPELDGPTREFLKSGITPDKWKEVFGSIEEEEDDEIPEEELTVGDVIADEETGQVVPKEGFINED